LKRTPVAFHEDQVTATIVHGMQLSRGMGVRLDNIRLTSSGGGTAHDAALNPRELGTGYPEPGGIGTLPAYGIYARHVRDLELANIHLNFRTNDLRPAMSFADIQGLEIDNVKPQLDPGVPAAVFAENVSDIVIRNSPALQK
jgi:catechol 2,3-dioxygenase-like lactoylglutathione lyase family enzyme